MGELSSCIIYGLQVYNELNKKKAANLCSQVLKMPRITCITNITHHSFIEDRELIHSQPQHTMHRKRCLLGRQAKNKSMKEVH